MRCAASRARCHQHFSGTGMHSCDRDTSDSLAGILTFTYKTLGWRKLLHGARSLVLYCMLSNTLPNT
jgi:hypothetical protein